MFKGNGREIDEPRFQNVAKAKASADSLADSRGVLQAATSEMLRTKGETAPGRAVTAEEKNPNLGGLFVVVIVALFLFFQTRFQWLALAVLVLTL